MTELRAILTKHNLGIERFAKLIGTTQTSLRKYERGDSTLKDSTKARIENGLYLVEQSGIVWPMPTDCCSPYDWDYYGGQRYWNIIKQRNEEFIKFMKESQ